MSRDVLIQASMLPDAVRNAAAEEVNFCRRCNCPVCDVQEHRWFRPDISLTFLWFCLLRQWAVTTLFLWIILSCKILYPHARSPHRSALRVVCTPLQMRVELCLVIRNLRPTSATDREASARFDQTTASGYSAGTKIRINVLFVSQFDVEYEITQI